MITSGVEGGRKAGEPRKRRAFAARQPAGIEHNLGVAHEDLGDRSLVQHLKPVLSPDDFTYLMDLVDANVFVDNMSFYFGAFRTRVGTVAIEPIEPIEASQTSESATDVG